MAQAQQFLEDLKKLVGFYFNLEGWLTYGFYLQIKEDKTLTEKMEPSEKLKFLLTPKL